MSLPASRTDNVVRVKQANDLVQVAGEYARLQRAGKDFKACCPFHDGKNGGREKTPSLYIYPDKQSWVCYGGGCGRGGSVIDWIMESENLEFREALEFLAKRANIELDAGTRKPRPQLKPGEVEQGDLHTLMKRARASYQAWYGGSEAQAYVKRRGITEEIARRFHLGYVPDEWDAIASKLRKEGWKDEALVQAGLVKAREAGSARGDGVYDRLRRRLVFPIHDRVGQPIGFGGRTLAPSEEAEDAARTPGGAGAGAKYLNSPTTELYDKSRVLFGLDLARETIRQRKRAIIMEGYTDVILAHQHGFTEAVATCGTSLTAGHISLLRAADELLLVFDGDVPGVRAAERALPQVVAAGIAAKVVILPDDLDPADILTQRGAEAFDAALAGGLGALAFKLDLVRARYDMGEPIGRTRAIEDALELALAAGTPIYRDSLITGIAEGLGASGDALREQVAGQLARTAARQAARETPAGGGASGGPGRAGGASLHGPARNAAQGQQQFADRDGSDRPGRWDRARPAPHGGGWGTTPTEGGERASWGRKRWGPDEPATWRAIEGLGPLELVLSPYVLEEIALACAIVEPSLVPRLEATFGVTGFPEGPLRTVAEWTIRLGNMRRPAAEGAPEGVAPPTLMSDLLGMLDERAERRELLRLVGEHLGEEMLKAGSAEAAAAPDPDDLNSPPSVREVFSACMEAQHRREQADEAALLKASLLDDPPGPQADSSAAVDQQAGAGAGAHTGQAEGERLDVLPSDRAGAVDSALATDLARARRMAAHLEVQRRLRGPARHQTDAAPGEKDIGERGSRGP